MRWILIGLGVLLILIGGLWVLQGIGVVGGSFMTGQSFWTTVGAITLLVGAALCVVGLRRASVGSAR